MSARSVVFRRELRSIFVEKTILLAIVLQVFVAGFSSFLVVGLAALVDPDAVPAGAEMSIAFVPPGDGSPEADWFRFFLQDAGASVVDPPSAEAAHRIFRMGGLDAVVEMHAPQDPESDPHAFTLTLPDGDLRATFALVQVREALENYERELRAERAERLTATAVYVDAEGGAGSYGFVYGLLIPLLVFLPVVLAGALTADTVTEEMERGTLPLLLSAPATPADVIEGKVLANALLAPLLTAAWLILLAANGLAVAIVDAVWITAGALAGAVLLGYLACVTALLTRDRNRAHVIYALLLFVLMGASLLLPVSPVNAVARLAVGSTTPAVHAVVLGALGLAGVAFAGFRIALHRVGTDGLLTPGRSASR